MLSAVELEDVGWSVSRTCWVDGAVGVVTLGVVTTWIVLEVGRVVVPDSKVKLLPVVLVMEDGHRCINWALITSMRISPKMPMCAFMSRDILMSSVLGAGMDDVEPEGVVVACGGDVLVWD